MLPVITARRDPAPSRIGYRLHRLWLTERFRWFLRRGLPLGIIIATVFGIISDGRVQVWATAQFDGVRTNIAVRPEMQIASLEIQHASPDLAAQIMAVIGMDLSISALDLDLTLRAERIDVAFLSLHGRYGEDGCVQGLLELFGIPYTGGDFLSLAITLDKARTKEVLGYHGVPTPAFQIFAAADEPSSFDFLYPLDAPIEQKISLN